MFVAAAAASADWLLGSGIYIGDPQDENFGGVYSYFDVRRQAFRLVYPEATGYFLSLLRFRNSAHPDSQGLEAAARSAGGWLVGLAYRHEGRLPMGLRDGEWVEQSYTFDNAICCKGLLDLHELTDDEKFLLGARQIAGRIVKEAVNDDGSVKPVFDLNRRTFVENFGVWYTVSGSFHSKVAMPLLQLYSIEGDEQLLKTARVLCEWALGQQQADGSFPANRTTRAVNLHAHCYTVEALLYAYSYLRDPRFLEAVHRAILWLDRRRRQDAAFPLWHGGQGRTVMASYVTAQAVRAFVLLHGLNSDRHLLDLAQQAAQTLLQMQCWETDRRVRGGFFEEHVNRGIWSPGGKPAHRVTSWATMFAIQAFDILERASSQQATEALRALF